MKYVILTLTLGLSLGGSLFSTEPATEIEGIRLGGRVYPWDTKEINLNYSRLNAPFPPTLEKLTQLKFLSLMTTGLRGKIPESLGNLRQLKTLSLEDNQLTGSLPGSLGALNSLKDLNLSVNQLTGAIPESLRHLRELQELDLSYNQLTGVPPAILALHLLVLDLRGNQLRLGGAFQESIPLHGRETILGVGGAAFEPRDLYKVQKNTEDQQLSFLITDLSIDHPLSLFNNMLVSFEYPHPNVLSLATLKDSQGHPQEPTVLQKEALDELNKAMAPFPGRYRVKKATP